ncbi:hypothetical protein CM15mP99_2570 [bacterium]|nr:MAG: hypothetical protein CM15mP99_2570 [bacterium]
MILGYFGACTLISNLMTYKIQLLLKALAPSEGDEAETINQIVELSQEARVNGLLSLEPKIKNIESEFLRTGLEMVVDGVDV